MSGPLEGIKILGFTHFAQAPFSLQLLGDLGADVINIERPGTGDFNRSFLSEEKLGGESPFFLAMNRNKKSVVLNLKEPNAVTIILDMVKNVDAVMSNYRPGVLDKLGLGYDALKKVNPEIIYCEALGYGSTGPYSKLPGQDLLAQSLGGYANICGTADKPATGGTYVIDMYSSMLLTCGLLSAVINKRSGRGGQKVQVNLLNSALHLQSQELGYYMNTGKIPQRPQNHTGHVMQESPYGIYKTKNGFMSLATNASEKVERFGEIIGVNGLPEMMPDKPAMLRDRDKLYSIIAPALEKQTTEYWLEQFQAEGFWCAKVNSYPEVVEDPQVVHNNIIKTITHPKAGEIKVIGAPIEFSETPATIRLAPPVLGEHTDEVLLEMGYSKERLEELKTEGVIG